MPALKVVERPTRAPESPEELDAFEGLFNTLIDAGRYWRALHLFEITFGGVQRLIYGLGDSCRCRRMLARFFDDTGAAVEIPMKWWERLLRYHSHKALVLNSQAIAASATGDIHLALRWTDDAIAALRFDTPFLFINRGYFLATAGRIDEAVALLRAIDGVLEAANPSDGNRNHILTGLYGLHEAAGELNARDAALATIEALAPAQVSSVDWTALRNPRWYAWFLSTQSEETQQRETDALFTAMSDSAWIYRQAFSIAQYGHLLLASDVDKAASEMATVRAMAAQIGHVDLEIRAERLAARIAERRGDWTEARALAEAGRARAEQIGHALAAIDFELIRARAMLEDGDASKALALIKNLRQASATAGYSWGEWDALRLTMRHALKTGDDAAFGLADAQFSVLLERSGLTRVALELV